MIAWLVACDRSVFVGTETFVDSGASSELEVSLADGTPSQAPRILVDAPFDGVLMVTWFDAGGVRKLETSQVGDHHEAQILGLLADTDYDFEITVFGERTASQSHLAIHTDPLPNDFPAIEVAVADGLDTPDTLLAFRAGVDDADPTGVNRVAVVRADGEVVWWVDTTELIVDVFAGPGGVAVMTGGERPEVTSYGWDLAVTGRFSVGGAGTRIGTAWSGPLHGSLTRTSQGYLVVQQVASSAPDLPLDYAGTPTGTRDYGDERGVVFANDGTVIDEEAASAFWPVGRLGWGSLDAGVSGAPAWADAARIEQDPVRGRWLWTLQNQDAVVSVDPATSDVVWALVQPYDLSPAVAARALTADVTPWHPGSATLGADLRSGERALYVFDAGAPGAAPPDAPATFATSRGLAYAVDESARTARLRFEVASPVGSASPRGLVREQPDGDVLTVFGEVAGEAVHAELIVVDPESGHTVRRQVFRRPGQGVTVRGSQSIPPLDAWSFVETSNLRTETTTFQHTGF